MKEQKVNIVVNGINRNPLLSVKEGKVRTKLLDERLNLRKYCIFKIFLRECIRQSEHIKKITASEYKIRQKLICRFNLL